MPIVPPVVAAASPEVSLNNSLGSMAQIYGLQSLSTWHTRHGNADDGQKRNGTHYWVRGFGAQGSVDGGGLQAKGAKFDYSSGGGQAGMDTVVSRSDTTEDRVGGYVSAGGMHSDVTHFNGLHAGRSSLDAYSVGAYWTRTSTDGWYLDAVGQYTRYQDVKTASAQGINGQTQGWGVAASLEGGKTIPINESWAVEPQAQLVVQHNSLDEVRDSHLNTASLGSSDSVLGRLGGRLVRKWDQDPSGVPGGTAWLRANLWHEFSGKSAATYQTALGPVAYAADLGGTWGELELGVSATISPKASIFGTVGYQRNLGGIHREATTLSGGLNYGGAMTAGVGLSMQLTPNAKLTTNVSYANGPKGAVNSGLMVRTGLDLKW